MRSMKMKKIRSRNRSKKRRSHRFMMMSKQFLSSMVSMRRKSSNQMRTTMRLSKR